jgi:hypothetical protein
MNLMLSGGLDVPNWGQNIKMTFAESINPQKCTLKSHHLRQYSSVSHNWPVSDDVMAIPDVLVP